MESLASKLLAYGLLLFGINNRPDTNLQDQIQREFTIPEDADYVDVAVEFKDQNDDYKNALDFGKEFGIQCFGKINELGLWHYRVHISHNRALAEQKSIELLSNLSMITDFGISKIEVSKEIPLEHRIYYNDPLYPLQWQFGSNGFDYMGITQAWKRGYTGRNVSIVIVDDGAYVNHPDLRDNYRKDISSAVSEPDYPKHSFSPNEGMVKKRSHGTLCAGVAVGRANNSVCGVGVAHEANFGVIKLLESPVNTLSIARAMLLFNDEAQIKSMSFGISGMKRTVLEQYNHFDEAIQMGIVNGRNGRGMIYVIAAGNSGGIHHNGDDFLLSNPNLLVITSANEDGKPAHYSVRSSVTIAATVITAMNTRGLVNGVVSSSESDECTDQFSGTSASAPMASGMIALVLQANPNLTHRDIMHLIIKTAQIPAKFANSWSVNGVGYPYNERIGFGIMDVNAMITRALSWNNVPPRKSCNKFKINSKIYQDSGNKNGTLIRWVLEVDDCSIRNIEHVSVVLSASNIRHSATEIMLISPMGTESTLLSYKLSLRAKDINEHRFTTIKNWGENPLGLWIVQLTSLKADEQAESGCVHHFHDLEIHGTE